MNMNTKSTSKDGKLSKYLQSAQRFLIKARDFYIRTMTECSDKVTYATTAVGCPTMQPIILPWSYSVVSSSKSNSYGGGDDDFRELIRAASTRGLNPNPAANNMARSHSVGIWRIDEDKPCDDFDVNFKVRTDHVYPRSRSHAFGKRTSTATGKWDIKHKGDLIM